MSNVVIVAETLKKNNIHAVFHYLSLHSSEYYQDKYNGSSLPNSDFFSDTLVRLPLFYELLDEQVDAICKSISDFVNK